MESEGDNYQNSTHPLKETNKEETNKLVCAPSGVVLLRQNSPSSDRHYAIEPEQIRPPQEEEVITSLIH